MALVRSGKGEQTADQPRDLSSSFSTDSRRDIIRPKLLPPLLIRLPHERRLGQIKLPRPQETEQSLIVISIVT